MFEEMKIKKLTSLLHDDDEEKRFIAIKSLGNMTDPRRVEPLIEALSNGYFGIRTTAAKMLGIINDSRAVEPLIKTLRENNEHMRSDQRDKLHILHVALSVALIEALSSIKDSRAVEPLIEMLATWGVQADAIKALGMLKDPRAVEPLFNLLAGEMRKEAADSLAQLGELKWSTLVKGDSSDYLRLASIQDARISNLLIERFGSCELDELDSFANALVELRETRAVGRLCGCLRLRNDDIYSNTPYYKPTCRESNIRRCIAATIALGYLEDPIHIELAIEPLVLVLDDPDERVREAAVTALFKIKNTPLSPELNKYVATALQNSLPK